MHRSNPGPRFRLLLLVALLLPASAGAQVDSSQAGPRDLVVLVHGMGRTPVSMWWLGRALEKAGFDVLNYGYSSYGPSVAEIAADLGDVINRKRVATQRVHFVGHSLGNIIIRTLLANARPADVGRIVMLGPPNQGSQAADHFKPWVGWLLAPIAEITTDSMSTVRRLPPPEDVEIGILIGESDPAVSVNESALPGAREHKVIGGGHTFVMLRPSVVEMTIRFLQTGSFGLHSSR